MGPALMTSQGFFKTHMFHELIFELKQVSFSSNNWTSDTQCAKDCGPHSHACEYGLALMWVTIPGTCGRTNKKLNYVYNVESLFLSSAGCYSVFKLKHNLLEFHFNMLNLLLFTRMSKLSKIEV